MNEPGKGFERENEVFRIVVIVVIAAILVILVAKLIAAIAGAILFGLLIGVGAWFGWKAIDAWWRRAGEKRPR